MTELSVYQQDVLELKAKLQRIEARRLKGQSHAESLNVLVGDLESLVEDHENLHQLLNAHPELRAEVPYA